ncbi:hypothetical protein GQ457_14G004930 [Hibiscus cannabinus]
MEGIVSLYVENLPEHLHWKGLWLSFARHGDVVDVYIARKRSKGGKKFGFVRMKGKVDADRAIERLHGFILYGWKLSVQVARNRYVRKGYQAHRQQTNRAEPSRKGIDDQQKDYKVEARIEKKIPTEIGFERENIKRIAGHVENEELWKLRRCLVGEMETVCSVSSIHDRLINWGLGDINVQRLGAKLYLLTFLDEDLFVMLEDGERRKKKAKRFGSLLEIQNKSLTDSERRKRDRALKRRKWSKHLLEESELSGKSLSDSDINNRISKMVSEAKQVLKLGKKIGCNIVGDEDEFINDLVDLELNVRKEG